jgi:hypothetical protein
MAQLDLGANQFTSGEGPQLTYTVLPMLATARNVALPV